MSKGAGGGAVVLVSILPSWLSKRQKVIALALGIYLVYIYQGVLFEDLHNTDYTTAAGIAAKWKFPEGVLLFTLTGNIVVASFLIWWTAPAPCRVEQYKFAMLSVPSFVAAGLTYMSMSKLDYPTLSLFKSAKPLAILAVAVVACRDHVYSSRQKIMVLCVSVALVLFFYFKEAALIADKSSLGSWAERGIGYAGLLTALASDGVGALIATHITKGAHPPSAFHLQLFLSLWSFGVVLCYAVLVKQLSFIMFLQLYPQVLFKLVKLGVLSGCGQLFIFATITTFDPLTLSILTTTRKVFTIVFSAFWFQHSLSFMQWFAVVLLFTGLLWNDVVELVSSYISDRTWTQTEENGV